MKAIHVLIMEKESKEQEQKSALNSKVMGGAGQINIGLNLYKNEFSREYDSN